MLLITCPCYFDFFGMIYVFDLTTNLGNGGNCKLLWYISLTSLTLIRNMLANCYLVTNIIIFDDVFSML